MANDRWRVFCGSCVEDLDGWPLQKPVRKASVLKMEIELQPVLLTMQIEKGEGTL